MVLRGPLVAQEAPGRALSGAVVQDLPVGGGGQEGEGLIAAVKEAAPLAGELQVEGRVLRGAAPGVVLDAAEGLLSDEDVHLREDPIIELPDPVPGLALGGGVLLTDALQLLQGLRQGGLVKAGDGQHAGVVHRQVFLLRVALPQGGDCQARQQGGGQEQAEQVLFPHGPAPLSAPPGPGAGTAGAEPGPPPRPAPAGTGTRSTGWPGPPPPPGGSGWPASR